MRIPVPDSIRRIADSENRKLAWHFFVFFSRFEYALKRTARYLISGSSGVQPDWDRFGSNHDEAFGALASHNVAEAVEYFLSFPPRKQIAKPEGLGWSEPQQYTDAETQLVWLLRMIRCVRNNLFHGGKFPLMPVSEPSRDSRLLLHSMTVLEACLPLDSEVERFVVESFEE